MEQQHSPDNEQQKDLELELNAIGSEVLARELLDIYPEAEELIALIRAHDGLGQVELSSDLHPIIQRYGYQSNIDGPFWTLVREGSETEDYVIVSISLNRETPSICYLKRDGGTGGLRVQEGDEALEELRERFPTVQECFKLYFVSTVQFERLRQLVLPDASAAEEVSTEPQLVAIHHRGLGFPGSVLPLVAQMGKLHAVYDHQNELGGRYLQEVDLAGFQFDRNPSWATVEDQEMLGRCEFNWQEDSVFAVREDLLLIIHNDLRAQFYTALALHPEADTCEIFDRVRAQLARESGHAGAVIREYQKRLHEQTYGEHTDRIVEDSLSDLQPYFRQSPVPLPATLDELRGLDVAQVPLPELPAGGLPLRLSTLPKAGVFRWPSDGTL